jgi:hypothetical protein
VLSDLIASWLHGGKTYWSYSTHWTGFGQEESIRDLSRSLLRLNWPSVVSVDPRQKSSCALDQFSIANCLSFQTAEDSKRSRQLGMAARGTVWLVVVRNLAQPRGQACVLRRWLPVRRAALPVEAAIANHLDQQRELIHALAGEFMWK